MEDNQNIMALVNPNNEIVQPVRLNYQIIDKLRFDKLLKKLECIDGNDWLLVNEAKKLDYNVGMEIEKGKVWILGKIKTVKDKFYVTINSIERGLLAIRFFSRKFDKKTIKLVSIDIYNKLMLEDSGNEKIFSNFANFFEKKNIMSMQQHLNHLLKVTLKKTVHNEEDTKKQLEEIRKIIESAQYPEYENFEVFEDREMLAVIEHKFLINQLIAQHHLYGDADFNYFSLFSNGELKDAETKVEENIVGDNTVGE